MKIALSVILSLAAGLVATHAHARYPDRPVRIVVGFAPGGAPDLVARIFAERLTKLAGQSVFVENRTGSAGYIAADQVANAPRDGYTLLLGADSQFAINPHVYPKMATPLERLTPVASLVSNQFFLSVNPGLPVNSVSEFVEYARKARPPLAYGSAGIGSQGHLGMEMLKKRTGIDMLHVPYRGASQAFADVIGGEVHAIISGGAARPQIESGKVRGLAVTGPTRLKDFPNLPSISEFYPGFEITSWYGLFVTAGVPEPVVLRLREMIDAALADPETLAKIEGISMRLHPTTREEFLALIQRDRESYGKLVKELGIKVE